MNEETKFKLGIANVRKSNALAQARAYALAATRLQNEIVHLRTLVTEHESKRRYYEMKAKDHELEIFRLTESKPRSKKAAIADVDAALKASGMSWDDLAKKAQAFQRRNA